MLVVMLIPISRSGHTGAGDAMQDSCLLQYLRVLGQLSRAQLRRVEKRFVGRADSESKTNCRAIRGRGLSVVQDS